MFAREHVKGVILKDGVGTVIIEVWKCTPMACVSKALCSEWHLGRVRPLKGDPASQPFIFEGTVGSQSLPNFCLLLGYGMT